ncbi:MAG: hypothetical protein M3Q29_09455, partial [Chloroflexota bacterium]|nr:hypothetical protein [Chloroflexota bacterium]
SGSVVTKVAIPAPQKSNFRVAFAPERMAMNMTTDPLVDKSGAPETAKHLLIGGSVGKDTLTVEGGYPREVAVGQRYVIYAHPMEGSPNSLLIDVAMPIAEQGRVVERAGTDEERRVPLEEAIRIITAGAAQTKWPIEP